MESDRGGGEPCAVCGKVLPLGWPRTKEGVGYCGEDCQGIARSEVLKARRRARRSHAFESGKRSLRIALGLGSCVTLAAVTMALARGETIGPRAIRLTMTAVLVVLVYRGYIWARWVYGCALLAGALMSAFTAASLMLTAPASSLLMFLACAAMIGAGLPLVVSPNVRVFLEQQRAERLGAQRGTSESEPPAVSESGAPPGIETPFAESSPAQPRERVRWSALTAAARKPALVLYATGLVGCWSLPTWAGNGDWASLSLSNLLCLALLLGATAGAWRGSFYARGGLVGAGTWLLLETGNAARALASPADWFGDVHAPLPALFLPFFFFSLLYAACVAILAFSPVSTSDRTTSLDRHIRSGFGLFIGIVCAVLLGRPKAAACRSTRPVSILEICERAAGPNCALPGCRPAVTPCVSFCEMSGDEGRCSGSCAMHQGRCVPRCEAANECPRVDCASHRGENECLDASCAYIPCRAVEVPAPCEEFELERCPRGRNCRLLEY